MKDSKKKVPERKSRKELNRQVEGLQTIIARAAGMIQLMGSALLDKDPDHVFLNPMAGIITHDQLYELERCKDKGRYREMIDVCTKALEKAKKKNDSGTS